MADVCSHQDDARKGVGTTAHGVASLRALESKRDSVDRLFDDPYAEALGGPVGASFISSFAGATSHPNGLVDGVAIRTKKIDDQVLKALNADNFEQICVLGAGLDTRPWRLKAAKAHSVHYFEVDFPEIFKYKMHVLNSQSATTEFAYHPVEADLSLDTWHTVLIQAGFDVAKPTFWILEGLTGYLTEEEANIMFGKISTTLSAKHSRIIATFLTPSVVFRTPMHRFFPENPLQFVNAHGWTGQQEEIGEIGARLNRPIAADDKFMRGYYIVTVDLL